MRSLLPKIGWMLAGVLGLFVVSSIAGVVSGGSLDPTGSPASTMLRLNELPPSWHQLLASNNGGGNGCNSTRFQCVMNDAAVLDRETGLVWERTVGQSIAGFEGSYGLGCEILESGTRYGWRLPTIHEMRTLVDSSPDHLPDGNPFVDALTPADDAFWTSTFFSNATPQRGMVFHLDFPTQVDTPELSGLFRRWCVRGGTEFDMR